jgi:hypothetical protein
VDHAQVFVRHEPGGGDGFYQRSFYQNTQQRRILDIDERLTERLTADRQIPLRVALYAMHGTWLYPRLLAELTEGDRSRGSEPN